MLLVISPNNDRKPLFGDKICFPKSALRCWKGGRLYTARVTAIWLSGFLFLENLLSRKIEFKIRRGRVTIDQFRWSNG